MKGFRKVNVIITHLSYTHFRVKGFFIDNAGPLLLEPVDKILETVETLGLVIVHFLDLNITM
jgi:hypothetical protein